MKVFTISKNIVSAGISIDLSPFPKIAIGKFNTTKKPTWIPIGQNDLKNIVKNIGDCRNRNKQVIVVKENEKNVTKSCRICGIELNPDGTHPDDGFAKKLVECDIIQLKNNNGSFKNYLIVAPKETTKDKVLILWRVPYNCTFVINNEVLKICQDNEGEENFENNEVLVIIEKDSSITAVDNNQKQIGELVYKGEGKLNIAFQR